VNENNNLVLGFAIFSLLLGSVVKYVLGFIVNCIWSIDNNVTKLIFYWMYWFLAFITIGILMSWRMAFVRFFTYNFQFLSKILNSLDNSKLWVASIFVSLAFDLLLYDPILIFMIKRFKYWNQIMVEVIKYNGIIMKT